MAMTPEDTYEICCGEGEHGPVHSNILRDPNRKSDALNKLSQHFELSSEPEKSKVNELKWHLNFINLADQISSWSKDPSTKCGAVIVDDKRRIVSTGYNGFPRGIKDTKFKLDDRTIKYDLTIHAELNAILFANVKVEGYTLYVTPLPPCIRCAVLIVQSGIGRVVSPSLPAGLVDRWEESVNQSKELFEEAGIEFIEI